MKVGYIIASNRIAKDGRKVGYLYREKPDNDKDSGWRVFAGDESQEYSDNPANFAMYNASTIVAMDPDIAELLGSEYPVMYERDERTGVFIKVHDQDSE